jgi:hypothetical protein
MGKPLCIDLYCGLGGWTEGFLAEGYDVVGFDIERHSYGWKKCETCDGTGNFYRHDEDGDFLPCDCYELYGGDRAGTVPNEYPAQLVIQDVLTLHGSQFKSAAVIVASPPCQAYSYRAMPWKRAKALPPPDNSLFDTCFRISKEAGVPLVVENVVGAQRWVGRAAWHYGSYYLWGDLPALMPWPSGRKNNGGSWFGQRDGKTLERNDPRDLRRDENGEWANASAVGGWNHPGKQFDGVKTPGMNWSKSDQPGYKPQGFNVTVAQRYREGVKQEGSGPAWFDNGICKHSSRSDSRKAASALIAKIPFELSSHIARCFKPRN